MGAKSKIRFFSEIILISLVVFTLTGCNSNKTEKLKENEVAVTNGKMETVKKDGFEITLNNIDDIGIITVNNKNENKEDIYILNFKVYQDKKPKQIKITIGSNFGSTATVSTESNPKNIEKIEIKINKQDLMATTG